MMPQEMKLFQSLHRTWLALGIWAVLFLCFFASSASANQGMIRPESSSDGASPLPILVQFTPSAVGSETSMQLSVDSGWTVAATPALISTTTTGLPSGTTAWPGIATATAVIGQTIEFPSLALNAGTTYGFYITGGIGTNPVGPHTRSYLWHIETFNGPSSIEVTGGIAVLVAASSQIVISASVLPGINDLPVTLVAVNPPLGEIGPEVELEYQVTYENLYTGTTPLTVQASWSLATPEGSSTPSITLLEYVPGSATDALGTAIPVIDTINRTITWTFASMPASSGPRTETFSLRTLNYDSAGSPLTFTVGAQAVYPVTTVPSEVTQTYRAGTAPSPSPTPKPTEKPSPTPSPTNLPTPTPGTSPGQITPSPQPDEPPIPAIESVQVTHVSQSLAAVSVRLAQAAALLLEYRANSSTSWIGIESTSPALTHELLIDKLQPNTQYVFRIRAQFTDGGTRESELFTFRTAADSSTAPVIQGVRLTSEGILIASLLQNGTSVLTLPTGSQTEIAVQLPHNLNVQRLSLMIESNDWRTQQSFQETVDGEYVARFTQNKTGRVKLSVQLLDFNGNFSTVEIGTIQLVPPLRILDKNGVPVEFATIFVRKYNPDTQLYEAITENTLIKDNPVMSDALGRVQLVLPHGSYRLDIAAAGFQPAEFTFELNENTGYPVITLNDGAFPVIGKLKNIIYVLNSLLEINIAQLRGSAISPTMYSLATFLTSSFFLLLASVALAAKTHIPFWKLPEYLLVRSRLLAGLMKRKQFVVHGFLVTKDAHAPLDRAVVTLTDIDSNEVVATVMTDRRGYFYWRSAVPKAVRGSVSAVGFESLEIEFTQDEALGAPFYELEHSSSVVTQKARRLLDAAELVLGSLFEVALIFALILHIFFFSHTNVVMEILLIGGSLLNLVVWTLFQTSPKHSRQLPNQVPAAS